MKPWQIVGWLVAAIMVAAVIMYVASVATKTPGVVPGGSPGPEVTPSQVAP